MKNKRKAMSQSSIILTLVFVKQHPVLLNVFPNDAHPVAPLVEGVNNRLTLIGAGDDGLALAILAGFILDGAAKSLHQELLFFAVKIIIPNVLEQAVFIPVKGDFSTRPAFTFFDGSGMRLYQLSILPFKIDFPPFRPVFSKPTVVPNLDDMAVLVKFLIGEQLVIFPQAPIFFFPIINNIYRAAPFGGGAV